MRDFYTLVLSIQGKLVTGQEVAVKRLSSSSHQGNFEFKNELRLMHGLQHRNIIQILGFCSHGDERILIYEYMRNRSLDQLLSGWEYYHFDYLY